MMSTDWQDGSWMVDDEEDLFDLTHGPFFGFEDPEDDRNEIVQHLPDFSLSTSAVDVADLDCLLYEIPELQDPSHITHDYELEIDMPRTYTDKNGIISEPTVLKGGQADRRDILRLLRRYYRVTMGGSLTAPNPSVDGFDILSVSSRQSRNSIAQMECQTILSFDGFPLPESRRRTRGPGQNERQALTRKLKACPACNSKKVKRPLYHHRLEDLLDVVETVDDTRMINWALDVDRADGERFGNMRLPTFDSGMDAPYACTVLFDSDLDFLL